MSNSERSPSEKQKRCFVVMGFGTKTDLATGRELNLDKSYKLLIKPVVEGKGLVCIRADEILHSGSIDMSMYQELFKADVVIADLSTANLNAIYELGVRHALRPQTTIVISEDKLAYPFDINHIKIKKYKLLTEGIDYDEVERFRGELGKTLDAVLNDVQPDSPVYTYLHDLIPPSLHEQTSKAVEQIQNAIDIGKDNENVKDTIKSDVAAQDTKTLAFLTEQGEEAIRNKKFIKAKDFFTHALSFDSSYTDNKIETNNPYLIQRLAIATYKAQDPDEISALKEAIALLGQLDLRHTNDPQTVAVAGAIEKRLFEKGHGDQHLDSAIEYFQRGYYLLYNRYHGINLAFMLNCRANSSLDQSKQEQIADVVDANRIRRNVLSMCENDLNEINTLENLVAKKANRSETDDFIINQKASTLEEKFWIHVNRAEAYFGLGELDEYKKARLEAEVIEHADWMMESFEQQLNKLEKLLEKQEPLLNSLV